MTVDEGAKVDLHPHKFGDTENAFNSNSVGIGFNNNSGSDSSKIYQKKDSQVNIICDNSYETNNKGGKINPYQTNEGNAISSLTSNSSGKKISTAIDSTSGASNSLINLDENAKLNVEGNGYVGVDPGSSMNPLVWLKASNVNINNKAEFDIKENENSGVNGNSSSGILNVAGGNFEINSGGSFNINSNTINSSNSNNFLLYSSGNADIDLNNPESVNLNDQDQVNSINDGNSENRSNSNLIHNDNNSFINATDVSFKSKGINGNKNTSIENGLPFHRLVFPINSDNNIDTNYVRILGSYNEDKKLSDSLKNTTNDDNIGRQYAMMQFDQMPTPVMQLSSDAVTNKDNTVSGIVKDKNGNLIKNAYVKIFINKSNGNEFFHKNGDSSDIDDLINANQLLYSDGNYDLPSSTDYTSGGNFSGPLNVDSFDNPIFYQKHLFSEKLDNNFLSHSKMIKSIKNTPYITKTDNDGNFNFLIPENAWNDIQNGSSVLDVMATYNFVNSNYYPIKVNKTLDVNINNSMKNLTKNQKNGTSNLDNVNQGTSLQNGDELEFDTNLQNNSKNTDFSNLNYSQPVPNSIDLNTLKIKDDSGNYIDSNHYNVIDGNGFKKIKLDGINLNGGDSKNLTFVFKLKNPSAYEPLKFKSMLESSDGNQSESGTEMNISFLPAPPAEILSIDPNDLYFTSNGKLNYGLDLISANSESKGVNVKDTRIDKTLLTLSVHQNNDTFSSDGEGNGNKFKGELYYKDNSTYSSLLDNSVPIETTESGMPLKSINWEPSKQIILKPLDNFDSIGNYQNGNKNKNKPGLTWTVTNGPVE